MFFRKKNVKIAPFDARQIVHYMIQYHRNPKLRLIGGISHGRKTKEIF